MDITEISEGLNSLNNKAKEFFNLAIVECAEKIEDEEPELTFSRCEYWSKLSRQNRQASQQIQEDLLGVISLILPLLTASPILTASDEKDVGQCLKRMRAALKLRDYRSWGIDVVHDEGTVLGVNPPGQSDDLSSSPTEAKETFLECFEQLEGITQILKITPANISNGLASKNPNLSQSYRPNTAFIMMPIDKSKPENEDVYYAYKECFSRFGVKAVRADEIEHEDVITTRIIEEIQTSEFLVGDLTNERPSVYYEIGYAHSLGLRVILYRKAGTSIHFDLAAYNCPEYKNISELKTILMNRLEVATNRKPKSTVY